VLVPLAARRSKRIIAISHSTADDLVEHLKVPRDKIDVVHEAADPAPHAPATPADELRARLELGDRPVLLSVSGKKPVATATASLSGHTNLPPVAVDDQFGVTVELLDAGSVVHAQASRA